MLSSKGLKFRAQLAGLIGTSLPRAFLLSILTTETESQTFALKAILFILSVNSTTTGTRMDYGDTNPRTRKRRMKTIAKNLKSLDSQKRGSIVARPMEFILPVTKIQSARFLSETTR